MTVMTRDQERTLEQLMQLAGDRPELLERALSETTAGGRTPTLYEVITRLLELVLEDAPGAPTEPAVNG